MLFALTLSAFAAGSAGPVSFNPVAGRVEKDSTLTITSTNATAICYTTDNSEPACKNLSTCALSAETDIKVTEATTIKAIGCNGSKPSDVATASYTINECKTAVKCQADEKCDGYKAAGWNNWVTGGSPEEMGKCVNAYVADPEFKIGGTATKTGAHATDTAVVLSTTTQNTMICYKEGKTGVAAAACTTPADGSCAKGSEEYTTPLKITANTLMFTAIACQTWDATTWLSNSNVVTATYTIANPTFAPLSTAGPVPADQAVTIKASVSTAGTTVCYTASKDTASKTDATCGTPADSGSGLAGVCGNDSTKYDDTSKPKVTTNHLIFSAIECLAANTSIGPVEQTYVLAPTPPPAPTTGPTPPPAPTTGPTPAPTTGPTTGPTPAKPTAGSYMLMPLVAIVSALMSL